MLIPWHHSPAHRFVPNMLYIVTAATFKKANFFRGPNRLELLQNSLLETLEKYRWQVQAWAVFPNHYHFVAKSPEARPSLDSLIKELHSITAHEVNRLDMVKGR
jgi:putative transposase